MTRGSSPTSWTVHAIFCPSGDHDASSSISSELLVMFVGGTPARRSHTFATKMSLSDVGAPRSILIVWPVPDADRWNAMLWLSGDQVAELPRTRNAWRVPSSFIR